MKFSYSLGPQKNKMIILFVFIITLFAIPSFAQTNTQSTEEATDATPAKVKYKTKKNVFRFNNLISIYPFQAAINYMTLGYEFKIGEKTAFKTLAGYAEKEGNILGINSISKYSGFRIEMQLKYFITKNPDVFNGVYFAPFALYKNCNYTYDEDKWLYDPVLQYSTYMLVQTRDKASAFHVGFLLGYHTKVGESFTIDMFAGEGLMSASGNYKLGTRILDAYSNEIRMKIGLSVGFGF